ncbi:unnamed protein product [Ilex paraguariensis]|uniref:Cytochrome P450 n=1 Tax=Ilex paraguariensis TaxID=185542 RepID=A0ABC8SE40_9AQUA
MGDFMPILKWVGFNGIEKKLAVLQEKRNQFMQDLIEEHRRMRSNSSSEKETKTMIDVLLSFQESEPEYCKDEIIKGMMLMIASPKTISSLRTALDCLPENTLAMITPPLSRPPPATSGAT